MKRPLFVLLCVALTPAARPHPDQGWVSLFNGKDLSGWKPHGQERWVVDKGEILGEALTGLRAYE